MQKISKKHKLALMLLFGLLTLAAKSNTMYFQTIRGTIVDQDSKTPIVGANIIIMASDPIMGTSSDAEGNFRIEKVPVGRVNLQVSCLGFENKYIPNLVVGSGKEVIIQVEMTELVVKLGDINVVATKNKEESLNEMATVSAKVFTVEETKRYAGTFNDPARMVSSFAGVTNNAEGNNDIVVRGNSPKGILWRLEGIEIPNPNHFAGEGSSGGPINALNSAMLSNSDFFSGAFAPEYGNAYSGVFDMQLRTGNNEKREYTFSAGALGIDFTLEGPFKRGKTGSYLINYRYSSLGILDDLGLVDFYGVPKYQDVSFHVVLPTRNLGSFSVFGLGGKSGILQKDYSDDSESYVTRQGDFQTGLGVVGVNHTYLLTDHAFIKNTLAIAGTQSKGIYQMRDSLGNFFDANIDDFVNTSVKIAVTYSNKINAQHRIKAGLIYTDLGYDIFSKYDVIGNGNYTQSQDSRGRAGLVQGFVNWKYRLYQDLTFVSGIHYLNFLKNQSQSVEPRLGIDYQLGAGKVLSMGIGVHSKVEGISTYDAKVKHDDGTYSSPNKDLGLAKASHFVIGYKHQITEQMYLKAEAYYQYLYNVAVENSPASPYVLNNEQQGWSDRELINKGKGRNYGLELTVERFYYNNFYFLVTGSLFDSRFTAFDGVERNSAFNGKFASNFLIGKEFRIGDKSKNRTLGVNAKITYFGGNPYTPLDLQASLDENNGVYDMAQYLELQGDNVFKTDFSISYRRDREKSTHELKLDVQNVTNHQSKVYEYYDQGSHSIESGYQWSIFPNVIYTIQF
ncbi:MAG TPA: TonB-dependent receptor [Marinilabiliales bacterium]|nr:TonB-dependent receptor [Marinilabiliales bacterium]